MPKHTSQQQLPEWDLVLSAYAKAQNVSLNKHFEEWATVALAQQDAQASYAMSQSRGDRQRGLALLDKLEGHFSAYKAVGA